MSNSAPLGVELNKEKTKVVDTLNGEAFGFLGFDLRRTRKRKGNGHYIQMTPKKKARKSNQGQGTRHHSAQRVNPYAESGGADQCLACWVGQLLPGRKCEWRIQRSARLHGDESVRSLLTRRKRRRKDKYRMAAVE